MIDLANEYRYRGIGSRHSRFDEDITVVAIWEQLKRMADAHARIADAYARIADQGEERNRQLELQFKDRLTSEVIMEGLRKIVNGERWETTDESNTDTR